MHFLDLFTMICSQGKSLLLCHASMGGSHPLPDQLPGEYTGRMPQAVRRSLLWLLNTNLSELHMKLDLSESRFMLHWSRMFSRQLLFAKRQMSSGPHRPILISTHCHVKLMSASHRLHRMVLWHRKSLLMFPLHYFITQAA